MCHLHRSSGRAEIRQYAPLMDAGVFDLTTLTGALTDVRGGLRNSSSPFAGEADAAFDNDSAAVGEWLRQADDRCRARDYLVARPHHPQPETIYVEMIRFEINPERWFAHAFACGPPPSPDEDVHISAHFDAIAGTFLGDVPIPPLTLTGMESLQLVFERQLTERSSGVEDDLAVSLVRLSFFALLDRAVTAFNGPLLRVAAAVHDEQTFAIWESSPA